MQSALISVVSLTLATFALGCSAEARDDGAAGDEAALVGGLPATTVSCSFARKNVMPIDGSSNVTAVVFLEGCEKNPTGLDRIALHVDSFNPKKRTSVFHKQGVALLDTFGDAAEGDTVTVTLQPFVAQYTGLGGLGVYASRVSTGKEDARSVNWGVVSWKKGDDCFIYCEP